MEVNRFLCWEKKDFLKLKPCLLGDQGMPGSGVCPPGDRETGVQWSPRDSFLDVEAMLGVVGSFAWRVFHHA